MREKITLFAARHGLAFAVLLFGLGYAVLTAPFAVPDEFVQFWRACYVSEGRILAEVRPGGERGAMLRRSVDEIVETLVHYRSARIPATQIDWGDGRAPGEWDFTPRTGFFAASPRLRPIPRFPICQRRLQLRSAENAISPSWPHFMPRVLPMPSPRLRSLVWHGAVFRSPEHLSPLPLCYAAGIFARTSS